MWYVALKSALSSPKRPRYWQRGWKTLSYPINKILQTCQLSSFESVKGNGNGGFKKQTNTHFGFSSGPTKLSFFFLRRCKLFSQNLSQHTVSTNNKLKGSLKINAITATSEALLRQTVRPTICWGRTSDSSKRPVTAQQSSKTVCLFTRLTKYYTVGAGDPALHSGSEFLTLQIEMRSLLWIVSIIMK